MNWSTITCLDCGHTFDADAALDRLETEIWKAEQNGGFPSFRRPTVMGTIQPVQCPECGLRMRAPVWPFSLVLIPFVAFWLLGLSALLANLSDRISLDAVTPYLWTAGLLVLAGIAASLIALQNAKPVRCGHY